MLTKEMIQLTIGERIRAARRERGVRQEALAKAIGVNRSAISKYENDTVPLKLMTALKIAEALDIDPYYLIDNDQDIDKIFGKYMKDGEIELPGLVDGDKMEEVARREELNESFSKLNETGQEEAVKRVGELTEIPRFQKSELSE